MYNCLFDGFFFFISHPRSTMSSVLRQQLEKGTRKEAEEEDAAKRELRFHKALALFPAVYNSRKSKTVTVDGCQTLKALFQNLSPKEINSLCKEFLNADVHYKDSSDDSIPDSIVFKDEDFDAAMKTTTKNLDKDGGVALNKAFKIAAAKNLSVLKRYFDEASEEIKKKKYKAVIVPSTDKQDGLVPVKLDTLVDDRPIENLCEDKDSGTLYFLSESFIKALENVEASQQALVRTVYPLKDDVLIDGSIVLYNNN